jgi:hypothetical protein
MIRELDPEGVSRRRKDLQRRRGEYVVPGPDFIWSIDGHDKLSHWGIQIYAAIDAYSRHIIWMYVGVSNRTTRSVLAQYLEACASIGCFPRIIRSDRGTETPMLAECHFGMRRAMEPGILFKECYFFGKSTGNQRIEAWWSQLQKGQLYRWRVRSSCTSLFF